jgi:predicted secreted protein
MSIDTNAQEYSAPYVLEVLGVPSIHYLVAAPHLLTDGATLNSGYYSSVLPANFLQFYGLTQESVIQNNVELTANYIGSTEILNSVVTAEPNGAVRITAEVFHYSKPTLITKFRGLPQSAKVGSAVKKGKRLTLPLKSTQGIATSWKSSSPNVCKVTSTKKTTKKKVGKKTVKTVTITKWQVQGRKKGTCTVVGTNAGNGTFGPASISKSIVVR